MSTVLRLRRLRVVIYPNDHRPAHVHVIGNGCEAVFDLHCPNGPPELRENYGFNIRAWPTWPPSGLTYVVPGRAFMVSREEFEKANARGTRRLAKSPAAVAARYDRRADRVVAHLMNDV